MIIKCLNCGGALRFDAISQKMVCDFCISSYDPEMVGYDLSKEIAATKEPSQKETETFTDENDDSTDTLSRGNLDNISYIDYEIYSCSACGAEVSVNGVESSTFCVYCGQPTILPDRVIRGRAPERIIPFSITKERALQKIHDHFNKGFFIPKDVVNCKPEHIRGIYIPYWLIDMDYEQQSSVKYSHEQNKGTITEYSYRWGRCHLKNITVDASLQLDNTAARRLDPYNLNALKPFDVAYLSGYYADCGDVSDKDIEELANLRAMTLTNEAVKKDVLQSTHGSKLAIVDTRFRSKITRREYVMLPAWFMTYHYGDQSYTFMVNGQTGKVIGASPFDKRNTILFGSAFFLVLALLLVGIAKSFDPNNVNSYYFSAYFTAGCGLFCYFGHTLYHKLKKRIALYKSDSILNFVTNRQGDDNL